MSYYPRIGSCTRLVLLFLALINLTFSATIYVDQNVGGGSNDGSDWANAYNTPTALQDALDAAELDLSVDQIWVAAGTYKPTYDYLVGDGSNRYNHFRMINGVGIYGGFAGSETTLDESDIQANETILSGDIGLADDATDNCFHVFFHPAAAALDATAILDGFTITAGNANDEVFPHDSGGGMYNEESSPTVVNCTFSGNTAFDRGGGMQNDFNAHSTVTDCTFSDNDGYIGAGISNYDSDPIVTNCTFSGNTAEDLGGGGGMANEDGSSPTVTDCTFSGNTADVGGGMYNVSYEDSEGSYSSPIVTNCTFRGNTADFGGGMENEYLCDPIVTNCVFSGNIAEWGGGMENFDTCDPTVINCTFSGNTADIGGGMDNYLSNPAVSNSIFWGNTAAFDNEISNDESTPVIAYCDVAGSGGSGAGWDDFLGTDGGGNMDAKPLFVDAKGSDNTAGTEDDNLQLQGSINLVSPCIDAADGDVAPATDLLGNLRFDHPMDNIGTGDPNYVDMGAYESQETQLTVAIVSPVDSDRWAKGQPYDIEWSTGNFSPKVKILLFKGDSKVLTIKNPTPNDDIHSWKIPTSLSKGANYRIKIICVDDTSVSGFSDVFEIVGSCDLFTPIEVSEPNDNTEWEMGEDYSIEWSGGEPEQNVKIQLFKGSNLKKTIIDSTPNDGEHGFTVPFNLTPGSNYQIKVKVLGSDCDSLVDKSDDFEIEAPEIDVEDPDSDSVWNLGGSYPITWSGDFFPGDVKIKLYKGTNAVETIADSIPNEDGNYTWAKVPYSLSQGENYRVKVISKTNKAIYGYSDYFEIAMLPINVTLPASDTEWKRGHTHEIQWTGGKPSKTVKINLWKAGEKVKTIKSETKNDGLYNWTVPTGLELDSDYSVEVIYKPDTSMRDSSDLFTVINSPVGTWAGEWNDIDPPGSGPLKLEIKNNGTLTGKFKSSGKTFPFSSETYTYDFETGDFSCSDASGSKEIDGRKYRITFAIEEGNCDDNDMTGTYSASIEKKKDGGWLPYEDWDGAFTVNR